MEGVQELMTVQEELDLRDRRIKKAEAKAQQAESRAEENEAKARQIEAKAQQIEAKARQAEAKAQQAEADAASEKQLTCLLLKENRVEDLKQAMEDTEYQKKLMKEYNLQ